LKQRIYNLQTIVIGVLDIETFNLNGILYYWFYIVKNDLKSSKILLHIYYT